MYNRIKELRDLEKYQFEYDFFSAEPVENDNRKIPFNLFRLKSNLSL
jgi:hypothetical protein